MARHHLKSSAKTHEIKQTKADKQNAANSFGIAFVY
jgi:hypothetical protein